MRIDVNGDLIQSGRLLTVGHINAVCGRNNSGKSTLLRAISEGKFSISEYLSDIRRIESREIATSFMGGQPLEILLTPANAVRAAIDQEATQGSYISIESIKNLKEKLKSVHKPFAGYSLFDVDALMATLESGLSHPPQSRKIVPAKRMLRDGIAAESREKAGGLDGTGILEHLFSMQSHRTDRRGMARLKTLEDAFERVTDGYRFEIDYTANKLFLYFRLGDGDLIPAKQCGLGLQDALIMLYACVVDDAEWLLIEEPENHLHPEMQRELLRFFSEVKEKTFFLATHSSVMLDQTYVEAVFQCSYEDGTIKVGDATSKAAILSDLGYSATDNLVADVILAVEGPRDKVAVEEIARKLNSDSDKIVRVWLLGGDIMHHQDYEGIKAAFDVRVLIDREKNKGSRKIRDTVKEECDRLGIPCTVLARYAMENYYSPAAYQAVYPDHFTKPPVIPLDSKVQDSIGFDPKDSTRLLARETSLEDLEGTDLLRFVRDAYSSD